MSETVKLKRADDDALLENAGGPNEVVWIETDYTEPIEMYFDCVVCGEACTGRHYVCLDGGDSAHLDCVVIEENGS